MVGRRGLQIARLQAAPQRLLMLLGPERRAHHVRRREIPIGILIDRIIDQQMPGQHLAEHALALVARARDRLQRFLAGIVHDIERHAQHLGDTDGAVGGLALHLRRARQRVAFRPCDAGCDQLLLQVEHQLAIFGMDGTDGAQLARAREAVHQNVVVGHDGAFIRHEMLEAVDAVLLGERCHVAMHAVVPPRHRHMEGIIAGRLLRPAAPFLVGGEQILLRRRNHEIDDHRGPTGHRRRRTTEEILRRHGAHEGQFHMRVRIDPARHHQLPAGIDNARARRCVDFRADLRDHTAIAQHIRPIAVLRRHHRPAANQRCHANLLCVRKCRPAPANLIIWSRLAQLPRKG